MNIPQSVHSTVGVMLGINGSADAASSPTSIMLMTIITSLFIGLGVAAGIVLSVLFTLWYLNR